MNKYNRAYILGYISGYNDAYIDFINNKIKTFKRLKKKKKSLIYMIMVI